MSLVGDNIARATEAGIRAAQLAPWVHCQYPLRNPVRDYLAGLRTPEARALREELEARWRAKDSGIQQWMVT